MNFLVTVRLVDRQDSEQPDPFFLGTDAEWPSVELMLNSMYKCSRGTLPRLDVRYWDDEDFVILSSQEELSEACRLASDKGILQLYVRWNPSENDQWPEDVNAEPCCAASLPSENNQKKTVASEALLPAQAKKSTKPVQAERSINNDRSTNSVTDRQAPETGQACSAASADKEEVPGVGDLVDSGCAAGADGAPEPGHKMLPGASSGANVIAIEMPECPVEAVRQEEEDSSRFRRGTEAAEPAEMAETGEVAPQSGRDAETGFWMVPKDEKKTRKSSSSGTKKASKDVRPKEPRQRKESSSDQAGAVSHAPHTKGNKASSSQEKTLKKKKQQQTDALTQDTFVDYMAKYQSELKRDIVKDVTRKTVRQVVEGISKLHLDSSRQSPVSDRGEDNAEMKQKWPTSVHEKTICDNCDQVIVGPRYKCGNCANFDLCEPCEGIYPPVHNASHVFMKLRRPNSKAGIRHGVRAPLLKRHVYDTVEDAEASNDQKKKEKAEVERLIQISDRLKVKEAKVKEKLAKKQEKLERKQAELRLEGPLNGSPFGTLSAEFLLDVTIPDGALVTPEQVLEKTWLMRNNGTMNWPRDTVLREVRGNMHAKTSSVPVGLLLPGQTTKITVTFVAPSETGDFESYWRLFSGGAEFGHYLYIKVLVGNKMTSFDEDFLEGGLPSKLAQKEDDKKEQAPSKVTCDEVVSSEVSHVKRTIPVPLMAESTNLSPAVPSTPTNTPFGTSPSGRGACVPPEHLPEALLAHQAASVRCPPRVEEEDEGANRAEADQDTGAPASQNAARDDFLSQRVTCYEWLKEQAAATRKRAKTETEAKVSQQATAPAVEYESFDQMSLFEVLPTTHIQDSDKKSMSEERSKMEANSHKDVVSDIDAEGFVICPSHIAPTLDDEREEGEDSADEDMYTSAYSPMALGLEMPVLGSSPVMSKKDVVRPQTSALVECTPELLLVDVETCPSGDKPQMRAAMSPGSTASSVEVVSVGDLEDFGPGEGGYRSIDTHGAWQPVPAVADLEREAEGFEIFPDDLSSMSDESSIDDDFCIVIPDCFDTSKPLKDDAISTAPSTPARMDSLSEICQKQVMKSQKPYLALAFDNDAFGADGKKDTEQDSRPEAEKAEEQKLEASVAETTSAQASVALAQVSMPPVQARTVLASPPVVKLQPNSLDESPANSKPQQREEAEEREETDVKTETNSAPQEADVMGAAALANDDMPDPGQQLNQLMANTVKAASSGLQSLFNTTKTVFKNLQENYEPRESSFEYKPSSYSPPTSTWRPSNTQYTPPRCDFTPPKSNFQIPKSTYAGPADFKPPQSNFQMPKSSYTGPPPPKPSSTDEFAAPLQRLQEMGYFNTQRCRALLRKYNGDVARVVNDLLQETDNDWAGQRH